MSSESNALGGFLGAVVAFTLSFLKWGSIGLAVVQGAFLGWTYVVYFLIRYGIHNLR
jgi:hypothetical protein